MDAGEREWALAIYSEGDMWSAADVLRHLTEAERGMTRLIEIIIQGGEGVPAGFDLNRYNAGAVRRSRSLSVDDLINSMRANREALLVLIAGLTDTDLERVGRHGSGQRSHP
jgi:hypothetical protein